MANKGTATQELLRRCAHHDTGGRYPQILAEPKAASAYPSHFVAPNLPLYSIQQSIQALAQTTLLAKPELQVHVMWEKPRHTLAIYATGTAASSN